MTLKRGGFILLGNAVLALVYFAAGKLGLSLAGLHESVSLVWPPTGLAMAALLRFGWWLWPGVFFGAFWVNAQTSVHWPTALGIAAGNTLESLTAWFLLCRLVRFESPPERLRNIVALLVLAGAVATTVSATIGVLSLGFGGFADWSLFFVLWRDWWIGDMLGALVLTPFLLVWSHKPQIWPSTLRRVEWAFMLLLVVIVGKMCFTGPATYPRVYLIFPVLIWSALRFETRGASLAAVLIAVMAIWAVVTESGPFATGMLEESLLFLQLFMIMIVAATLPLAVIARQLRKSNEELQRLNRIKSDFTSMVSHELRTPLSSIREGVELVMDGVDGPVTSQQKETLGIVRDSVDRLAKLINNVLDFTKLEAGRMTFSFAKTDMNRLLAEAFRMMLFLAQKKGLDYRFEEPRETVFAVCDAEKIREVVINLLDNAIKFTQRGGTVVVRLAGMDGPVRIDVEDTGPGLAKEDQARIFTMFEQIYRGTMWKTGGAGMGLTICRLIVEKHDGKIRVESEVGKGSRFSILLPAGLKAGEKTDAGKRAG